MRIKTWNLEIKMTKFPAKELYENFKVILFIFYFIFYFYIFTFERNKKNQAHILRKTRLKASLNP